MDPAFLQQLTEKMAERLQEVKSARKPDTFSVFLREGKGLELQFEPWVYEEVSRRSSLPEDWDDHASEFEFRSSLALWEVCKEFSYSVVREGRDFLLPRERRHPQNEDNSYAYRTEENIPLALKPYTRILDFEPWGESLYFDYDRMKADALDAYMESGNTEQLRARYQEIQQLQNQYPNKHAKDYEAKCVRIQESRPREISDEQHARVQHTLDIIESDEGRQVLIAIEDLNSRFPEALPNVENTPTFQTQRERWNEEASAWYNAIQNQELRALVDFRPNRTIYTRMNL